jgi:hypothetical protein
LRSLGILRRGALSAIVCYGRHANDTEIEPGELSLIRRIGAAAALAYETAEVATLRERKPTKLAKIACVRATRSEDLFREFQ